MHYAAHNWAGTEPRPGAIEITAEQYSAHFARIADGQRLAVIDGKLEYYRGPVQLIDAEGFHAGQAGELPEGAELILDAPPAELIRPRWDGSAWVEGEDPAVLEAARKERLHAHVNAVRDSHEQGGFTYNGWRFDSDAVSVARIHGAALAAQTALAAGEPFSIDWTDADNVARSLDAQGVLGMQLALVEHANACHVLARDLKARVAAGTITTEAEIDGAGWP